VIIGVSETNTGRLIRQAVDTLFENL
jgi:hypothetical protein